jgi:serine/threonine protein kinase
MLSHRRHHPLENILCATTLDGDSEGGSMVVKISDFGLCARAVTPHALARCCGTPGYIAPEVLRGIPYGAASDMFSVGVILFIMLSGSPPFYSDDIRELIRINRGAQVDFSGPRWAGMSDDARALVQDLMHIDPSARPTPAQAIDRPWVSVTSVPSLVHLAGTLTDLRSFNARRKFRAAAHAVRTSLLIKMRSRRASNPDVLEESVAATASAAVRRAEEESAGEDPGASSAAKRVAGVCSEAAAEADALVDTVSDDGQTLVVRIRHLASHADLGVAMLALSSHVRVRPACCRTRPDSRLTCGGGCTARRPRHGCCGVQQRHSQ